MSTHGYTALWWLSLDAIEDIPEAERIAEAREHIPEASMDPRVISHFIGGTWSYATSDWITASWSWECTACPDSTARVCAYIPVDEARDHLRDVHGIKDWLPATLITDAHGRRVGRYCRCHGRGCHSCWVLTCAACGAGIPPKSRTGCCPSCGVRATGDYLTPVVVDAPVIEVSYAR